MCFFSCGKLFSWKLAPDLQSVYLWLVHTDLCCLLQNQRFCPLVISESTQLLASYFQTTCANLAFALFQVLGRSLPCRCLLKANPWTPLTGAGHRRAGEVSGMLCGVAGNFFVPVSFMSESGWWLTGHGDKLIPCVSLFFFGLKSFPVHSTVFCEVWSVWPCLFQSVCYSSVGVFMLFQFSVSMTIWLPIVESLTECVLVGSDQAGRFTEPHCEGRYEPGEIRRAAQSTAACCLPCTEIAHFVMAL